jgi:hypothetical protein
VTSESLLIVSTAPELGRHEWFIWLCRGYSAPLRLFVLNIPNISVFFMRSGWYRDVIKTVLEIETFPLSQMMDEFSMLITVICVPDSTLP